MPVITEAKMTLIRYPCITTNEQLTTSRNNKQIFGTKKYSKSYKAIAKIKEKKRTLKAKSNVLKLLKLKKRNTNPRN